MAVRVPVTLGILLAVALVAAVLLWPRTEPASAGGPTLLGDVNCDGTVNSLDAAFVLQYDAGLINSLPCPQNADVNGDGSINAIDAALMIQYCICPIITLPPASTSTPSGPPGPSPTPTPTPAGPLGDVNCDESVNAIDAALILQFHARLVKALPCERNGDVNGDGSIDSIDAALILPCLIPEGCPPRF